MPHLTRRAALLALTPALFCRSLSSAAAPGTAAPAAALPGTYALPEGQAKVSASLTLAPAPAGAPSAARVLDVAMTRIGATRPITRYEVELSKRLHLIAISGDLTTFVHEHGERPGADAHFSVPVTFPHGGPWHVYADAVPAGLGQQVFRFDLTVGDAAGQSPPAAAAPSGLEAADGPYTARFDPFTLRAGQESQLALHLSRDGRPAADVTPFLGVAAHAVFINAADLTYVHVHAAPAAAPGTKASASHDAMAGMAGMEGMGAPLAAGSKVPPDLTLHIQAPKAGTYRLWIQFMAGGQVRTVPFVVTVA